MASPRARSTQAAEHPDFGQVHAHAVVTGLVQGAPPVKHQQLLDTVTASHGLFLYPRLDPTDYRYTSWFPEDVSASRRLRDGDAAL